MDRVRLGRVLGRGARLVARTAVEAVQAAAAPAPAPTPFKAQTSQAEMARPATPLAGAARSAPAAPAFSVRAQPRRAAAAAVSPASRAEGRFAPVRRASRAVSLEVSGSFFALFALSFYTGMWHARSDLHQGTHGAVRFGLYGAIASFFLYCSVSNFLRARQLSAA